MKDLIERQAALDCFHEWIDKHGDIHTPDEMAEYRAIEALPSVQPEIIRCKDCKYKKVYCFPPKYNKRDYCEKHEKPVDVADFCSYAERQEE